MVVSTRTQLGESFCKKYDLRGIRATERTPFPHQSDAIQQMGQWFDAGHDRPGGILSLPTGGGKTFTAWNFLCKTALSEGYKVLWLAHTHHLLEQAFESLEQELGHIQRRRKLMVRVVSGTKGHFKPSSITPDDDVVIATLQTARNAYNRNLTQFHDFIKSAGSKLFVVFDEAHHAPATSYCKLLNDLREQVPKHFLLGLTATPTYTDKKRRGWLTELFQQRILYQINIDRLIERGILAKPIYVEEKTDVDVELSEAQYRKWMQASRDLPDDIVTQLAENHSRNEIIAEVYAENAEKYGKTIIFADRKVQCIYLKEALLRRKIKADFMFTHIEAEPSTADERNKITKTHNKEVLEKFKTNELQVLINVQMLTTGTDIPDVNSVFLTRQTTSEILLKQMIGRALRGPRVGGTKDAYIVSFIDNWQQIIDWPVVDPWEGEIETIDPKPSTSRRREVEYISIDLISKLGQIEFEVTPGPFLSLIPIGWYLTEIEIVDANDDSETTDQLAMVFEHEKKSYEESIEYLFSMASTELKRLVKIDYEEEPDSHSIWAIARRFFAENFEANKNRLLTNLYRIAKHIDQNDEKPQWFDFAIREEHDLDAFARRLIKEDLKDSETDRRLDAEYHRTDRYWQAMYKNFEHFQVYFDACKRRVKKVPMSVVNKPKDEEFFTSDREVSDAIKAEIRRQDQICQCCGSVRDLEIDHIKPQYEGGIHDLTNLQLLCRTCNQEKGIQEINFIFHNSPLAQPQDEFPFDLLMEIKNPQSLDQWDMHLRRSINFFYQASVVHKIHRFEEKDGGTHWSVELVSDNDPKWLRPYLQEMTKQVQREMGYSKPSAISYVKDFQSITQPPTRILAHTYYR